MLHGKRNIDILNELDGYVSGHIEAKKALISLVNRSRIRHYQKLVEGIHKEYLIQPHKLLLIGQSGTGKTHLVESLQSVLDFPLIRIDATKLNPTGASGGVKEESLRNMINKKAKECVELNPRKYFSVEGAIDQMVVFIDEIDKLGKPFESSGNWNTNVQSNFLTLFDNKSEFAGVSFIFAGAFTSITGEETHVKKSIGFTAGEIQADARKQIDELVVDSGLIPELVGRLTSIVELDKFSEDDFYDILVDRLIPKKLQTLAFFNTFDVLLTEEQLREMSNKAYHSGQGIRSLQRQLDKEYLDVEFENEYKSNRLLPLDDLYLIPELRDEEIDDDY